MKKRLIATLLIVQTLPSVVVADSLDLAQEALKTKAKQYVIECSETIRKNQVNNQSLFRTIMLKLSNKHPRECVSVGAEWLQRSFYEAADNKSNNSDQAYRETLATFLDGLNRFRTDLGESNLAQSGSLEYRYSNVSVKMTGTERPMIPTLTGYSTQSGN